MTCSTYLSIRALNEGINRFRISAFEESVEPELQNAYRTFTRERARELLQKLGMTAAQSEEVLSRGESASRSYAFRVEISPDQFLYLRQTMISAQSQG